MTNIPKKLELKYKDHKFIPNLSYEVPPTNKELMEKINEYHDYLQAKEEASKGECECCKSVVFEKTTPLEKCVDCGHLCSNHSLPETKGECMRAGWCDSCDTIHKSPFEDGRYKNPPEHEESWEKEIRDENWDTENGIMTKQAYLRHGRKIGTATTPLKVEMIIDYIKANFVSKEKIKRAIEQAADCAPGTRGRTLDAISKSLGLGD